MEIVNYVVTSKFNCNLDLEGLKNEIPYFEYNRNRFIGAILKLKQPKQTFLIFRKGNVVLPKAKSYKHALKVISKLSIILQSKGNIIFPSNIKVVNIVACGKIKKNFSFFKLCNRQDINYEPEKISSSNL